MKTLCKIIAIISILAIYGCASHKRIIGAVLSASMKVSYEMIASQNQVDSIISADNLPQLNTWIVTSFKDFETQANILKRMDIEKDGDKEVVYTITGNTAPFKVVRRIRE